MNVPLSDYATINNYLYTQNINCNNEKFMIEVKPSRFTKPPKKPKRQTKAYMAEQLEYIKNKAKWQAAKEYCSDNGLKFKIFTEKELAIPQIKR